ncbi:LytTR family DNA-binding domain-containing protein [Inquilinus limosus]|uniref:HTH LytTR-type domain-containing protein n=1 Tax=Inquilinus limosus TaxID=171674 RepID=A0A211ZUI8_9PROT|nr:LytTR family DNA-binding domain-containing protein [Inquilinus limosus]OWJ68874.1 hypothetical protein BWR60_01960 [Inquilinus limosus]
METERTPRAVPVLSAESRARGDYLVCRLLRHFEAQLPTPPFVRISRSLIVNLDQLERVDWREAGRCSLSLGDGIGPVMLGRIAARRLRQSLDTRPEVII